MRKHWLAVVVIAAVTGACGRSDSTSPAAAPAASVAPKPLEILIDWQAEPTYLGLYYAKATGEYRKAGFDVKIVQSWGANEAAAAVAAGTYKFGTASGGATVIANSKGADLVSMGVLYHKLPTAVFGLASTGIKTPKDLQGKKVGIYPKSITRDEFEAFAKSNGVDLTKVDIVSMSGADLPLVLSGSVDAAVNYFELSPTLLGFERPTFEILLDGYGVKAYGLNMITSRKTLESDSATVRALTEATVTGYRSGCDNQAAAVDAFVKEFPDRDRKYVETSWGKVCAFIGGQFGDQNAEGWKQTITTYAAQGLADAALRPESLMPVK